MGLAALVTAFMKQQLRHVNGQPPYYGAGIRKGWAWDQGALCVPARSSDSTSLGVRQTVDTKLVGCNI